MKEKDTPTTDKLRVDTGFKVTQVKTITEADIMLFAELSGDFNPVHMVDEYAKKTFFKGRIAHGVISLGLLSAAMAKLPGLVVFISQSTRFLKPVRIGDTITAIAEVIDINQDNRVVTLKSTCTNQNEETVVSGEATVRLFKSPS